MWINLAKIFGTRFLLRRSDPDGHPIPRHPEAARIKRAYKLRQQLVENPGSVSFSGFFFVAVNNSSESLRGCCYQVTAVGQVPSFPK